MKISKLVSVLSALTIAASAFAGLAVTANADDSYSISEVLYGTTTTDDDGNITAVSAQKDFDENYTTLDSAYSDANGSWSDTTLIAGTVLYAGTSAWTKSFSEAVTSGRVHFSGYYTVSANNTQTFKIVDSSGNAIYSSGSQGSNSGNATCTIATVCGTEITSYCRNSRKSIYFVDLTIDLDAKTVTGTVTSSNKEAVTKNSVNVTLTSTDVAGLSAAKTTYGADLDTVMLYSEENEATTYPYTINYTCDGTTVRTTSGSFAEGTVVTAVTEFEEKGTRYYSKDTTAATLTVAADETGAKNTLEVPVRVADTYTMKVVSSTGTTLADSTSVIEGDTFSYAYPKYLTDSDSKVTASCDESTYSATVTPTASETITIPYTAYTGTAYFIDAGTDIGGTTYDSNVFSNGYAVRGFTTAKTLFTVPEDGVYTIDMVAVTYNYGKSDVMYLYNGDDTLLTADINTVTISKPDPFTVEGVELSKDDVLTVMGSNTTASLDYVLLTKTSDITESTEITAEAVAAYEGKDDSKATAFKATLSNTETSAKVTSVSVESNGASQTYTAENGDFTSPTLTSTNAVIGIVVNGIEDTSATVKVTFK